MDLESQQEEDALLLKQYGLPVHEMEVDIRQGFVRKVFGILTLQLIATLSIISLFSLHEPLREYVDVNTDEGHPWVLFLGFGASLICLLTLTCCANQARSHPNNVIILTGFTLAESIVLGVVCATYTLDSVLVAVAATIVLVASLMGYSFVTKRDFTGAGPYLFVSLLSLILFGFTSAMFGLQLETAYAGMGVLLFSFYIVFDTQLILGGKHHKYQFGVDEHIFASLHIYLDIVNLFLDLLRLFGRHR